jgi:hypothetical protein
VSDPRDTAPASDQHFYADGRPKSSPDDTSLLGLHAVWSELDEPLPEKGTAGRHGSRRARRQARTAWRVPLPLVVGIAAAVGLTIAIIFYIASS